MAPTNDRSEKRLDFGIMFFNSGEDPREKDKYRLLLESARFADLNGFSAVWVPERHFTEIGCLYPNPAVLHAALARETKRVRLRAGSVVLPLHHPLRVAEEWAMVDNLSSGRVDISFASGWSPDDFALAPDHYADRAGEMFRAIDTVRQLWRGKAISVVNGKGETARLRTYPTPLQRELPVWVTAAGNPSTFVGAGRIGANLLTHLFDQDIDVLASRIALYRAARAEAGHDPDAGRVAVMLHTFVGTDLLTTRASARAPYCEYLKSSSHLLATFSRSRRSDLDVSALSGPDLDAFVEHVFDKFAGRRSLIGTAESCLGLVQDLRAAGVDEIASLLDFGLDPGLILDNLVNLLALKERSDAHRTAPAVMAAPELSRPPLATVPESPEQIRARLHQEMAGSELYRRLADHGASIGPRLQGLARIWFQGDEALGRIDLSKAATDPSEASSLRATLLDASFQVTSALLLGRGFASTTAQAFFVPVGLDRLTAPGDPGGAAWSHAVLRGDPERDAEVKADVRLYDEAGRVVAEARGLRLQRHTMPARRGLALSRDWLYEIGWIPAAPIESGPLPKRPPGEWIVFTDAGGVGAGLVDGLRALGGSCVTVEPGSAWTRLEAGRYSLPPRSATAMRRLLHALSRGDDGRPRDIIYLWSLDTPSMDDMPIEDLDAGCGLGMGTAMLLLQALMTERLPERPRVWFVTRGAQAIEPGTSIVDPIQAPLWGLGRSCAIEAPDIWGGLVDLDPGVSAESAAADLVGALTSSGPENQIACRSGRAHHARLRRIAPLEPRVTDLRRDATYLITGGLSGLGFETARWMVQRGARHLLLIGRTALPAVDAPIRPAESGAVDPRTAYVRELEAMGAAVEYGAIDVADEASLRGLLEARAARGEPPIRGVVHSASTWRDSEGRSLVHTLDRLDWDESRDVLRPKIVGGWLLYRLLADAPLDFFVLYSSGASLLGSDGLGNYACANAFLDAFAHTLRARGLNALTINWGTVASVGFGVTADGRRLHEYLDARGLRRLTPPQVVEALALLLPTSLAQVAVLNIEWDAFGQAYPQLTRSPVFSGVASPRASSSTSDPGLREALRAAGADTEGRLALVRAYLHRRIAATLRLPDGDLDHGRSLIKLGLDSLTAIDLKNRLASDLGVNVPVVAFLRGPNLDQLADEVVAKIAMEEIASARHGAAAAAHASGWEASEV